MDPARRDAGPHDHVLGLFAADGEVLERAFEALGFAVLAFAPADQVVGGAAGKVFNVLDAVLTQRNQHGCGEAGDFIKVVLDAELLALFVMGTIDGRQVFGGAVLDFASGFLVEAVDRGNFIGVDIGQFLDRGEAFGSQ